MNSPVQIIPYEKNAKPHPQDQIDLLIKSIERFGWQQPIKLGKDNVILCGHGRFMAWQQSEELQKTEPWCIDEKGDTILGEAEKRKLTKNEEKAYRILDNQINEMTKSDANLIHEEVLTIDDEDLTMLIEDRIIDEDERDDAVPATPTVPKSKLGDIYELGNHRLLCGDSTKEEDLKVLMNEDRGRMIFTDPPYNVDYKSPGGLDYASTKFGGTGGKIFNDNKTDEECLDFYTDVLRNLYKFTTDDVTIYWWFANINNHINRQAFDNTKWHMSQIIVWLKNSMVFSRGQDYHRQYEPCMVGWKKGKKHYKSTKITKLKDIFNLVYEDFLTMLDVWYQHRDNVQQYVHPTQKPVKLAERALAKNSAPGDVVVDMFLGSGSTLVACEKI